MVNDTEFCFTSLKTHWRSLIGKVVPLDAVWALGSRGGVVDSVFGAGLHPRSCILCQRGDIWVRLRAGLRPRSHILCQRGDIWVAFSLCFLLSKEPCRV